MLLEKYTFLNVFQCDRDSCYWGKNAVLNIFQCATARDSHVIGKKTLF